MMGMKNHFDISDSIEICEVDIAGVACIYIPGGRASETLGPGTNLFVILDYLSCKSLICLGLESFICLILILF